MNDVHGGMDNGVPQIRRRPAPAAPTPAPNPLEEVDFPMVDDYRAQVDALEIFNRHREAQRRLREEIRQEQQAAQEAAERQERAQRVRQWQAEEAEDRELRRAQIIQRNFVQGGTWQEIERMEQRQAQARDQVDVQAQWNNYHQETRQRIEREQREREQRDRERREREGREREENKGWCTIM